MMQDLAVPLTDLPSTWHAGLNLRVARTARGTRLVDVQHHGPLYIQRAFYPEGRDLAHIYLLHPPGGLVSGDELRINATLDPHTQALFTTPGAGRVYRARPDGAVQSQTVQLNVGSAATAEWLPLETILYNHARTRLTTEVHLGEGASFIGWEVTSLGLPARGERFEQGELTQTLRIYRQKTLCLQEKIRLTGNSPLLDSAIGMRGFPMQGIFVAGPFETPEAEPLLQAIRELQAEHSLNGLAALTLVSGFIVGRYLGDCSEQGRRLFQSWWQVVRPALLQRSACAPRIWLT